MVEEREVVGGADEDEHEEECLAAGTDLCTTFEHAERHHGARTHVPLPGNEENENHSELRVKVIIEFGGIYWVGTYHGEIGDDRLVIPRLGLTAPLESEEEGSDGTEREDGAEPIERLPLLPAGHAFVERRLDGIMSRKEDGDGGD